MTTKATLAVDGRTQRRHRNLDKVVDAVIELARAGNLDPTSEEIAAIAGVSHRSIYRYFDTRAELLEAAVAKAFESASSAALQNSPSGDLLAERVEAFVSARVDMYRQFRSIARVASAQLVHATASAGLEQARLVLRIQLAERFARELDRFDPDDRGVVLAVVDALFQFEALEYLSDNAGLDDEQLRWSLARHLHRHLA